MAPHRNFKYDIVTLCSLVKDRPVIWDRSLEIYKDKIERKNAWEEIFNILEPTYDQMGWEEKRTLGEYVVNKWTNVRDTFVKSLKTKAGKPKRRYVYHDHVSFLTKVVPEDDENEEYEDSEPPNYMKQEMPEEGCSSSLPPRKKRSNSNEYTPKKSKRSRRSRESPQDSDYETFDTGNIDFVEVDSKTESDPRIMNEDEAFFASLLPTVVRYNEDERLEFRIEVLAVMKKIKDKRKWQGDD